MPCKGRPAAVEFICFQDAYKVRGSHEGNPNLIRYATYWNMDGESTWLRYYHVYVEDASDYVTDYTKLDLEGFERAMSAALARLAEA